MRAGWLVLSIVASTIVAGATGCPPPTAYAPPPGPSPVPAQRAAADAPTGPVDASRLGALDDRMIDFAYDGGQIEFELYRAGSRVVQVARNRYASPIMIRWTIGALDNLAPTTPVEGVAYLPPATAPFGVGPAVALARFEHLDASRRYHRVLSFRARFGDPRAEPSAYAYALPYPPGLEFSVLQGFHGAFSHRGSNEFAIDFDCPVATPVLAARDGVVIAAHAAAQGAGTTAEFLDYKRTNFVLVLHDDGTLGEYMHLAPASVSVKPGQRVERGQRLALSGNTGFSSTPHLHFQVMTAGDDGVSARSFPFVLASAPGQIEPPVQGRRYAAWETR